MSKEQRRRRWIVGVFYFIGIVLLIPFFVPDRPPPFKFLEGAKLENLWMSNVDDPTATYGYMVGGDYASVVRAAKAELKSAKFSSTGPGNSTCAEMGDQSLYFSDNNYGTPSQPLTSVSYDCPAGFIERIRAPLHQIHLF